MHTTIPTIVGFTNVPWNKGHLVGQKRPLRPKDVWAIRVRLQLEGRKRDLALFNLAIDSKLRGCDLVALQVEDVCAGGRVRDRGTVIQKKTGRPVQFEITEQTRASIRDWLSEADLRSGRHLFPSRSRGQPHLSTRQYARIVHAWVESAGLDSSAYGTHSMRRTKAAQIYRKTGNLRAVELLLGHTKLDYLPHRLCPAWPSHRTISTQMVPERDIAALSEAIEKCEKLVVGSIASRLAVWRYDGIENPLLQLKVGVQGAMSRASSINKPCDAPLRVERDIVRCGR